MCSSCSFSFGKEGLKGGGWGNTLKRQERADEVGTIFQKASSFWVENMCDAFFSVLVFPMHNKTCLCKLCEDTCFCVRSAFHDGEKCILFFVSYWLHKKHVYANHVKMFVTQDSNDGLLTKAQLATSIESVLINLFKCYIVSSSCLCFLCVPTLIILVCTGCQWLGWRYCPLRIYPSSWGGGTADCLALGVLAPLLC